MVAKLHDLMIYLCYFILFSPSLKIDQIYFIEAEFSFLRILNQIDVENLIRDNRRTSGCFTQAVSVEENEIQDRVD